MNGAGEIKPFHVLGWFSSLGNAAESDKRDLMAELDTMKQLNPHHHVTGKLRSGGCSGEFMMLLDGSFFLM